MSLALGDRPTRGSTATRPANGGAPARRAVVRWAGRLFRREWRQQLLVLTLLTVAVGATTAGAAIASNAPQSPAAHFGTANYILTIPGSDPQLAADLAAARSHFGTTETIEHQKIAIPGSLSTIDLRAEDPHGFYGHPTLHLDGGRYPTGPGEVAVTRNVAARFDLGVGGTWREGGRILRVVGLVENPLNLGDQFALVAPGQANPPANFTLLLLSNPSQLESFRLPSGTGLAFDVRPPAQQSVAAIAVLVLSTIGLLFVGLVAVAGFTVMAQRRLRALGMLKALGATDHHVRLVMLANGAAVGTVAATAGTVGGLAGWFAFAPHLATVAGHRIDRFDLPWWAVATAFVLAVVTAIGAAWWPARSAGRISVVAALSGRPPRPQPAHRFAAAGGLLLAAGLTLLAFSHQDKALFIVGGIVATTLGVLLLAPLAIRAIAAAGRRAPIAVRLALRDLARYQARSGAALGAVTLAVGIAAAVAIGATATAGRTAANLPGNQALVYASAGGPGGLIPDLTAAQGQTIQSGVNDLAAFLRTSDVLTLDAAVDPTEPDVPISGPGGGPTRVAVPDGSGAPGAGPGQGGKDGAAIVKVSTGHGGFSVEYMAPAYVATPAVLAHYGISASQIDPTADIVTSRTDLAGLSLGFGAGHTERPKIQTLSLPKYTSDPTTLITSHAVQTLGLTTLPAAWLIQTPTSLTTAQINTAQRLAAAAGVTVETKPLGNSVTQLRHEATGAGILVALGVLAMTVGLIRSETANDLRTLTAAGASSTARRTLTATTAAALALLGALLGTSGAYLALIASTRSNLRPLGHVPVVDLILIVIGLPLAAAGAGWLLAGREPPGIARQPLE